MSSRLPLLSLLSAAVVGRAAALGALALGIAAPGSVRAQEATPKPVAEALLAIDQDYGKKLHELDQKRLDDLRKLAAGLAPKEAAVAYEHLFRLAIAGDLFQEAEPAADAVIAGGETSPTCQVLARLVKLVAEVDRGEFDQSLADLRDVLGRDEKAAEAGAGTFRLSAEEVLEICEGYYQRLLHAGRPDIARKAFEMAVGHAARPEVKEFLTTRLNRLKLVGMPAPPIRGLDLDGKPFDLAGTKGKVVLVVFWASWCLPNAVEVEWLQQVYNAHHDQGLEIVGVNLDLLQAEKPTLDALMPNIRRFALDYNLRWPNVISQPGDGDIAAAYGVTEIPANALIGRDGKIAAIDLPRKSLAPTIARLMAQ